MAYEFKNAPLFSKIKIGETVYYVKDAEVRELLATYGNAVTYNVDASVTENGTGLVTGGSVASYVTDAVAGLAGAMHFIGVKEELPATGNDGDIVIVGTAEYVYSNGAWVLIGDEGVYATVAGVEAAYVKKALTIAGIDLKDDITAVELQTALGLGSLAYKNSAQGTIDGLVTGVADATYKPEGTVNVTLTSTSTAIESAGTYTPVGNVTGNVTAAGSVAIARDENGFAVSGAVSAPTITVTPATAQIQHIADLGSLPTYTAAQYQAPSVAEQSSNFATAGLVAAIDNADAELLVFSPAATSSALTATGFNAGSYTAAEFNAGALPSFGAAQTGVTGIASAEATAPVFTGDKIGATFSGSSVDIAASFEGTQGAVSVTGNYDKASVDTATFAGTEATISHEVTTGAKTVTVQ